jgi:glutaredoxin
MDDIVFIKENGENKKGDIVIFALSTCAFCKKALKFLKENSICFSYVFIDEFDFDKKTKIKMELREKYNQDIGFPFLILNGTKVIIGFTEEEYRKNFLEG